MKSALSVIVATLALIIGVAFAAPSTAPVPSSVKVGPYVFKIVKAKTNPFQCGDAQNAIGCTDDATETITYAPGLSHTAEQVAIWHEVQHAITDCAVNNSKMDNEQWVENTSVTGLEVLKNNPALVAYLTAK